MNLRIAACIARIIAKFLELLSYEQSKASILSKANYVEGLMEAELQDREVR